jgi:hypothetical protein
MRLTLRTLLAYIDDRLPPENAKELGQKIAHSPFSTELVERIREVKRRRRLAMPAKPVAMIDANLIAEYLDDQLTPELVARIEREVLASDAMLAEVASAHEILGMLRDPVTIEPQLRDRLYALDPTGATDVVRVLANENTDKSSSEPAATEWDPQPVRRESLRRVPIFILAGLVLVWMVTVVSDSVLFGPKTGPEVLTDNNVAEKILDPPEPENEADESAEVAQINDPAKPGSEVSTAGENVVVAADPNPEAKAEPMNTAPEASVSTPVVAVPAADVPPVIANAPVVKADPETVKVPASAVKTSPVHLMTNNKTFFVFDESLDRWMRLDQIPGGEIISRTRNSADCRLLFQKKWFAIAEPFSGHLSAGDGGWDALFAGNFLGRLPSDQTNGLEIYAGRLKLSPDATQPWDESNPPAFKLTTGSVTSTLVLQAQDTVVGIEVIPRANSTDQRRQSEPNIDLATSLLHLKGSDSVVKVTVVAGQIAIQLPGIESDATLSKGKGLSWIAAGSSDPSAVPAIPENITPNEGSLDSAAPTWLHSDTSSVPESEALDSQIKDALANSDDPALAVIPLLSDRNPQLGVRAVYVLTATHDVDRLLSALFESLDEAVHRSAIDGLSYLANGSDDGSRTIRNALETRIPMSEVDITLSLIRGFGDAEARDPDFCQQVIDLLNNERLATRTLAFYRIQQYSTDRLGYQPEAESSRRRDAVRRWQKFIDRNGGRMLQ